MGDRGSRLRLFIAELKRRRVFRVVGVYAVVAFVVLQVADVAFPALLLPAWATTLVVAILILGFPVAIVLAWAFDITAGGVKRTEPLAAEESVQSDGGRGVRSPLVLLLMVILLVVFGGSYSLWHVLASAAPPVSATRIAVLPFSVQGSEEFDYLAEGMVHLLSRKLDDAGNLRSVDPHALLSFVAATPKGGLDPERGRDVAEHFGAGFYVLGNVLEAGGRLQLDASLYDLSAGLRTVAQVRVDDEAQIFELVDELAERFLTEVTADEEAQILELADALARRFLAGRTGGTSARLVRLAAVTTSSFPALKAYLEGESELRAGRYAPAAEALQRAVDADSSFALAWYRLGVAATWGDRPDLARDAAERAVRYGDRLLEPDRQILAAFQAWLAGMPDEPERLYRAVLKDYPDDVEAWYMLGGIYEQLGEEEKAILHYQRFIELWKDADPELHPRVEAARRAIRALSPEK